MRLPALTPIIGVIMNISPFGKECCSHLISLRTSNGVVNFVVSNDTYIVDCTRLQQGMRVAAFYDPNVPVPLIFPPQYQAEVVTPLLRDEQVTIQYFDQALLSADHSLQLNIITRTHISTTNGQNYECSPGGNTLLVFYQVTTRSIPALTTPRKIIVFC